MSSSPNGLRPVTLSVLRLGDELSMALTDSRGLARIEKVAVSAAALDGVAKTCLRAAEPNGSHGLERAGADLFDRLFPEAVRSFLRQSPPRHLQLQLAQELLWLPWEQAFDGESFLGEKFPISRQMLSGSEYAEPRAVRVDARALRVAAFAERGDPQAARTVSDYRPALEAIDGLAVTWVDGSTSTTEQLRRLLEGSDVCHWIGRCDEDLSVLFGLVELQSMPALFVVELAGPTDDPRVEQTARRLTEASQRDGANLILQLAGTSLHPRFATALYAGLAQGEPLAVAVANARRQANSLCLFYGNGQQTPRPLASRINTDDSHRQVTILSYDLVDSTRMLAAMGAERYSELLSGYHQRCAEIVHYHGGTAEDARGDDGVMCYFGLPVATEGSAEQCILAALEIQNVVRSLDVQTRIGIATGEVAVRDNLPHGVPVHLAARLQSIATPGTVVVAESTRQLVKDRFDFELLAEPRALKGIDQPGKVYRVSGVRPWGSLEGIEAAPSLTPFVGRGNELRLLREHWASALTGGVRVVRVSGDAGIGKSRLVREFRSELAAAGARVMECRCTHDHSASPFHPVIEFLYRTLQISDGDSAATRLDKIAAFADGASKDGPALIARLFSLPFEQRFGRLDYTPERLRERTLQVLLSLFRARTRKTPTCLIVEDANWSDPSSGELLSRLVASAKRVPLLVILTLRSEAQLSWDFRADSSLIEVRGLDPESARALVVAASGGARLPKDVVRALAERGDGVPLFIEESTRMAVELGTGGHSSLEALRRAVPATIQDLLMARLDRLGNAKQVAQIGGTIGREFPLTLLRAVVEHERAALSATDLAERLRVLTASGMLVEKGDAQNRIYYFKHALVRDAAYNSLWERDRLRLHRAIAEVVAAQFPEIAESQPELLAYHYTEAHQDREALAYWERAARHAASRSANYEAIDHLQRGLALLMLSPEGSERDRIELRLMLLLAARLIASEGYGAEQVESVYRRALGLCTALGDESALVRVQLGLEGYHFMQGDFAQARAYADQAAAMAARGSDPIASLQARWAVANIVMHQGDFVTAVEQMDACLKTYEELKHRPSAVQDPGVMCLCYSAWGLWEMGYPDQALERAARAVDLANTLRHSFSMGVAFGFRSTVHHFRGEYEDARVWAERAIEVCEDAGFVVWLAHAKVMHGRILAELGEPARGVEEMRVGYDMWAETGAVVTQPFYLAMQCEGLLLAGQLNEARAVIDHALQLVEANGERYYEAEIRRLRGELMLRDGDGGASAKFDGERWLLAAHQVAATQKLGSLELRAALSLAQFGLPSSSAKTARRFLTDALGKVHGGEATLDVRRGRRLLQELRLGESVDRF